MARVALNGGFYKAKWVGAACQRCLNLYPEANPQDAQSPVQVTHYQTPGLVRLADGFETDEQVYATRLTYTATNGDLYEVVGQNVYYVSSAYSRTSIGTIPLGTNPCSMADNGLIGVLVDGTPNGWYINLTTRVMTAIVDEAFYGADRVDYVDTFFTFNRPHTNQWYISPSEWDGLEAFDPLDIAAKVGTADDIASQLVNHREVWLFGNQKGTEVWYNSGAADFAFERLPGVFINHGCAAKYSVQRIDTSVFWLSRDEQGQGIVLEGVNYEGKRISTHAIEQAISQYETIEDATSFTYQQEGHSFYVLTFPTADKTWAFDLATRLWHERAWIDENGCEHRIRSNTAAFAYGVVVTGDWEDGRLYKFDLNTFTDDGDPIVRRRGFPHQINDSKRVFYLNFIADVQVASGLGQLDVDEPQINLRYSDTRGESWGNPVRGGIGSTGQYIRSVQFNQLGMARDRVFELFWSAPQAVALNGAWIQTKVAAT
jgi:hypothetical protein